MFRDLIVQMGGVVYPMVGLVTFLFAFGVVLIRALREPRESLDEQSRIPLDEEG